MAEAYKVLGQSNPVAAVNTNVYAVPAGKSAVVSTITVANNAAAGTTFRISVAKAAAVDNIAQYVVAALTPISGRETIPLTIGITLEATDVIRVFTASANISVNIFGTEIG